MNSNQVIRAEAVEATFNIYTDHEKSQLLSVTRIEQPVALDSDGKAIPGGLYDESMGPLDHSGVCRTCHSKYAACSGHPGHIELYFPVYYPVLFSSMFQLLKSKCFYCHKLRMSVDRVRVFLVKLKLLEMGDVEGAMTLDDAMQPSQDLFDEEGVGVGKGKSSSVDAEPMLRTAEQKYRRYMRKETPMQRAASRDSFIVDRQNQVIDAFQRACVLVKGCENCNAITAPLRQDQSIKVFQKPMPKRQRKFAESKLRQKSAMESWELFGLKPYSAEQWSETTTAGAADGGDEGGSSLEEDARSDGEGSCQQSHSFSESDRYLMPVEVEAQLRLLWMHHEEVLDFIWLRATGLHRGSSGDTKGDGWRMFFTRVVLVPPSRFRPPGKVGDMIAEHPQNTHLKKVLVADAAIRAIYSPDTQKQQDPTSEQQQQLLASSPSTSASNSAAGAIDLSKVVSKWIELQNAVNCYMDSSKDSNVLAKTQGGPAGIRQILERKEGLFRKHMMGKRVNFCCRSVISPDPYIGTNEIGVPVHFAMSLHYPTPVNSWNVKYLRGLVRRGPFQYPGANQIELADGRIIKLDHLSDMELAGKAKLLLPGIKVHRHLIDGDMLLVNRQPTLHKPGIMAHKARILMHVKEQTLRMHYANCNTYNADFDGDEMNCHFVQSELARAEASFICGTDQQYIGPTSGSPLRGLIQDHVASAVKLTCKDTFLSSAQFQQLVYVSLAGLPGTEIVTPADHISLPAPAILRPRPLWTGKQVVTALLAHLCRPPLPKLNLDAKAKTPATAFGEEHMEHEVVFRCGELLCGVLDKGAIGSSSLGIVHTVYELYGPELAGRLLGAFGKLFTCYLQTAGQTCGIQDLTLTRQADAERARLLKKVQTDSAKGLAEWLRIIGPAQSTLSAADRERLDEKVIEFMSRDRANAKILLDSKMQSIINASASDVIKACIPAGLEAPFTRNNFSIMVLTGAKGSSVNQSQISCFLGQQALEGQRVPLMVSGKSLPSFRPYDPSARAGGFVQDRFLTGVRPQEYFFHCMAGREGLVDTAVKTSRSGYLQRCLIKHLEELKVQYDMTVRDSAGNIVQFLYGEDGLDPVSASLLRGEANQMRFLARNNQAFVYKHSLRHDFFNQGLEIDSASAYHQRVANARRLLESSRASGLPPAIIVGSVVQARRKKFPDLDWDRSNITGVWHTAVVKKVRHHSSSSSRALLEVRFDLQFSDDGLLEKKVPLRILMQPRQSAGGGPVPRPGFNSLDPALSHCHKLPIYLVRPGLPDPAMSKLRLDYCVGAISERLQGQVDEYVKQNSDEVLASEGSDTTITPESLELLVWVKYLRSLACPGEAVGCVAAQSVGEPSTQMTLNTFHLAGHGGANVTLGIPRLREVIMVASRKLKTPTMFAPMRDPLNESGAEALSNKLSLVPLSHLLSHAGGIEVGEQIRRAAAGNKWERCYRLCLRFEDVRRIERTFGFPFASIVAAVKGDFLTKLDRLIKLEQRRTGDSTSGGMNEVLKTLLGKDKSESGRAAVEMDRSDADSDDGPSPEKKASKGKASSSMWRDGSGSEDDDSGSDEGDLNGDMGNLKLSGSKKEVSHYEDDDSSDGGGPDLTLKKGSDLYDRGSDDDAKEDGGLSDDDAKKEEEDTGGSGALSSAKRPSKKSTAKPGSSSTSSFRREAFTSDEARGWVQVELSFPARSRRLLMTQLVEKASRVTMVRETKNIVNAFKVEREARKWGVMTEGVNFEALWLQDDGLIATNEIESNDIWQILCTYGVEAARHSIVSEIKNVFAVYGINVDPRHLSLIADYMTRHGSYLPLNRSGMLSCPSPLQRMSFESTCSFLTRAAIEGQTDSLQSPSARIVLGGMTKVGTGCFDVMLPLSN